MNISTYSEEEIKESLYSIVKNLILNKVLVVNNVEYSFIDLEIYYWHELHQDDYAKGVKHTRPLGDLELHKYGVDISLGNKDGIEFGGILIRGLFDIKKKLVIPKSEVVRTLYNNINIGDNRVELIEHRLPWDDIFQTKRINLGTADNANKLIFKDVRYRFLAKDKSLFASYKGKEKIFADSNLSDQEITDLLGYKIKL